MPLCVDGKIGLTLRVDTLKLFKNGMLKRTFKPKMDKVTRRKMGDEFCNTFYSMGIRTIKSRRMRWIEHKMQT